MATIDIGSEAIVRPGTMGDGYTWIAKENPANDSGTITSVEAYCDADCLNAEVATFYATNSTTFQTRDWEAIGTITGGAKRTFIVDITVEAGDLIGIYFEVAGGAGGLYRHKTGYEGIWFDSGDQIPGSAVYATASGDRMSLYGTGETVVAVKKKNVIFMGSNF